MVALGDREKIGVCGYGRNWAEDMGEFIVGANRAAGTEFTAYVGNEEETHRIVGWQVVGDSAPVLQKVQRGDMRDDDTHLSP